MGVPSVIAIVLVVLKALGLTTLAWGWCLLGFGVDIVLAVGIFVLAFWIAAVKDNLTFYDVKEIFRHHKRPH